MPSVPEPLYPIFIKWMPFHIPILFLMYAFIVMKLLNYFKVIDISFEIDLQKQTQIILNIIVLIICYQILITAIIYFYKKVLLLKIQTLQHTGNANIQQYEKHKRINTEIEVQKLQRNQEFIKWKRQKIEKQQHEKTMPKVVYELIESSSSEQQLQRMSEHRLATSKRIF